MQTNILWFTMYHQRTDNFDFDQTMVTNENLNDEILGRPFFSEKFDFQITTLSLQHVSIRFHDFPYVLIFSEK